MFQVPILRICPALFIYKEKQNNNKRTKEKNLSGYFGEHRALFCVVWSGDDTIMSLLKVNQERKYAEVAGTSQHTILPSATHLLPRGAATCYGLSWTAPGQTRPGRHRLGLRTQPWILSVFFHFPAFPGPLLSVSPTCCLFPQDAVQLYAKNSKAKKIFFV